MNSSEDIFRKAVDEMTIFWNESTQNIANRKAISNNRFEWLNDYCDSLFERWESSIDFHLAWAHKRKRIVPNPSANSFFQRSIKFHSQLIGSKCCCRIQTM